MREVLEEKNEKERIEAGEREREKERKREKFNERRENNKILLFFLASCYSAHLFMNVHCNKKLKKFRYAFTIIACILMF